VTRDDDDNDDNNNNEEEETESTRVVAQDHIISANYFDKKHF
jgi:hypothetical protein